LREGKVVLCDRFTDSSEAYQGHGRQLGSETILQMHRAVCQDFWPDLTILLVGDVKAGLERARERNVKDDEREGRFEREQADFFQRVADGYASIAVREPRRVATVNASRSIDEVHGEILGLVRERLPGVL
jgi:dTMP kinase